MLFLFFFFKGHLTFLTVNLVVFLLKGKTDRAETECVCVTNRRCDSVECFCCGCSCCVIGSVSFPDNHVLVQGLEEEAHCMTVLK